MYYANTKDKKNPTKPSSLSRAEAQESEAPMPTTNSTTYYLCRYCSDNMVETLTPAGDPCIECMNSRCRWTIHTICVSILETKINLSFRLEYEQHVILATK